MCSERIPIDTYLIVNLPFVLDGVSSQLTHGALTKGIVQNEQLLLPERLFIILCILDIFVHLLDLLLDFLLNLLFVRHGAANVTLLKKKEKNHES